MRASKYKKHQKPHIGRSRHHILCSKQKHIRRTKHRIFCTNTLQGMQRFLNTSKHIYKLLKGHKTNTVTITIIIIVIIYNDIVKIAGGCTEPPKRHKKQPEVAWFKKTLWSRRGTSPWLSPSNLDPLLRLRLPARPQGWSGSFGFR